MDADSLITNQVQYVAGKEEICELFPTTACGRKLRAEGTPASPSLACELAVSGQG